MGMKQEAEAERQYPGGRPPNHGLELISPRGFVSEVNDEQK